MTESTPQPQGEVAPEELPVHERPEVKPLIEKAGVDLRKTLPQGTMKTGADVPGGGGTHTLDMPPKGTMHPIQTPEPDEK